MGQRNPINREQFMQESFACEKLARFDDEINAALERLGIAYEVENVWMRAHEDMGKVEIRMVLAPASCLHMTDERWVH
jgi:hypothetical protein